MRPVYCLIPFMIIYSVFAEIHSGEILLRLGEVIDFDSGYMKIATKDTAADTTWTTEPNDSWFGKAQAFCRFADTGRYDLGFFFNGFIVDCFGAPAQENCTESLKSIYAPVSIYKFKNFEFFKDLDNPVDTTDTASLFRYPMDDESFWDNAIAVDCSLSQGPQIPVLTGGSFFGYYYFLVTDEGKGCIFTILKRDTVNEYCLFDRYNAIRIKYYLQTEANFDFSSIAGEIRERITTDIKRYPVPVVYKGRIKIATATSMFDILGRVQRRTGAATVLKIRRVETGNACGVVKVK